MQMTAEHQERNTNERTEISSEKAYGMSSIFKRSWSRKRSQQYVRHVNAERDLKLFPAAENASAQRTMM